MADDLPLYQDGDIQVGDVLSFAKGGRGLPDELAGKFFRVLEAEGEPGHVRAWKLSPPYDDAACTIRYRPTPPRLRNGRPVLGLV
jgi:hypothetical protein